MLGLMLLSLVFAPITGAWIETRCVEPDDNGVFSHLSQVRGLKPLGKKIATDW